MFSSRDVPEAIWPDTEYLAKLSIAGYRISGHIQKPDTPFLKYLISGAKLPDIHRKLMNIY